jgi:hypothetical protein
MADDGTAFVAIAETTSFLNYFNNLPDYHQAGAHAHRLHKIVDLASRKADPGLLDDGNQSLRGRLARFQSAAT